MVGLVFTGLGGAVSSGLEVAGRAAVGFASSLASTTGNTRVGRHLAGLAAELSARTGVVSVVGGSVAAGLQTV